MSFNSIYGFNKGLCTNLEGRRAFETRKAIETQCSENPAIFMIMAATLTWAILAGQASVFTGCFGTLFTGRHVLTCWGAHMLGCSHFLGWSLSQVSRQSGPRCPPLAPGGPLSGLQGQLFLPGGPSRCQPKLGFLLTWVFGLDLQSSPADPPRFTLGQVSGVMGRNIFTSGVGSMHVLVFLGEWPQRSCLQSHETLVCTFSSPTRGGKDWQTR